MTFGLANFRAGELFHVWQPATFYFLVYGSKFVFVLGFLRFLKQIQELLLSESSCSFAF